MNIFAVVQIIHTGFEKLNVMDLLPDDSIVVSVKGCNKWPLNKPGTQPSFVKYNRLTGDRVCSILSKYRGMPDGMALFTTATGDQRLAFSYGSVFGLFFSICCNLFTNISSAKFMLYEVGRLKQ